MKRGKVEMLRVRTCIDWLTKLRLNEQVLGVKVDVNRNHFAEDGDVVAIERVDCVIERP